ncbi:MAG: hypothetical protein WBF39_13950 [Planococcus donghaensis]
MDIQREEKDSLVKDIRNIKINKNLSELISENLYGIKFDDSTMKNISRINSNIKSQMFSVQCKKTNTLISKDPELKSKKGNSTEK